MRQGRVMLLTLLAFVLPTAASANSIDYDTGNFLSGKITGTLKTGIMTTQVGSLATITIDTGTLAKFTNGCTSGFTCYDFTGGSVTVDQGVFQVFSDSLSGGLTVKNGNVVAIAGALSPMSGVAQGTAVETIVFQGPNILTGSSDISYSTTVPEPSALEGLLLGTGLLGLVEMTRRKLQLGT